MKIYKRERERESVCKGEREKEKVCVNVREKVCVNVREKAHVIFQDRKRLKRKLFNCELKEKRKSNLSRRKKYKMH